MTESGTAIVLRIERVFAAPARAVFDAWTSPEVLKRWCHPGVDWTTAEAEVDLWVGGRLRIVMRTPDGEDHGASGEYNEVRPPERVVFTWLWDRDPPDRRSLIELDFAEEGGTTTVILTQSGLSSEESREGHREGWGTAFDNLERMLER